MPNGWQHCLCWRIYKTVIERNVKIKYLNLLKWHNTRKCTIKKKDLVHYCVVGFLNISRTWLSLNYFRPFHSGSKEKKTEIIVFYLILILNSCFAFLSFGLSWKKVNTLVLNNTAYRNNDIKKFGIEKSIG